MYSHAVPIYWSACIYTYQCIYYYLSICLSTYLFIRVCVSQISCYIGLHPSFIHSFLLSIHTPSILDNHVLNEPSSKQPQKKSCIDYAWIRGSIIKSSCLMRWPPRGFLQVLCQPKKGMDPQHPSTVNRISVNFSSALVLSLPWSRLLPQAWARPTKAWQVQGVGPRDTLSVNICKIM